MSSYDRYFRNRYCPCARCRIASSVGPAVLVTLGVLFLLETLHAASFERTWPVLLIVIGVIQVLRHSASIEGHVPPPLVTWMAQRVAPHSPPPAPGSAPMGFAPSSSQASTPPSGAPGTTGGGSDHV